MLNLKIHKIPTFVSQPTMIAALPDMGNVAGMGMTLLTTNLVQTSSPKFMHFGLPL